jgi:hypothetical protein
MKTKYFIHCFALLLVIACSQTPPVIPEAKNVEVSRKPAKRVVKKSAPLKAGPWVPKGALKRLLPI